MSNIIEIAKKEIGYIESKGNDTKYGKWFELNNLPWCGIFVSWVYFHANVPLPKIGFNKGFASCQFAFEYFKKTGKIVNNPEEGNIVLYDFSKDGRYDHTGIFVKWTDSRKKYFIAIEGNTSTTNNRNGGSVMQRTRNCANCIFVKP